MEYMENDNCPLEQRSEDEFTTCPCVLSVAHSVWYTDSGILTLTAICIQLFN